MKSVGIHLCVNFCSMPCINFLPSLISSTDNTSFAERFSIYWRDSIMLTGIVISIITAVAAIFQGAFFLAFVSASLAGILSFGAYYVSRYAELTEMEAQLQKLQAETKRLTELSDSLQDSLHSLGRENHTFTTQNEELRSSLADFRTQLEAGACRLEETKREFEEFKQGNEHLRETSTMLSKTRKELDESNDRLRQIAVEYAVIQGQLRSDTASLHRIQQQIEDSSRRLAASAERFEALEAVAQRLGQYVDALPSDVNSQAIVDIRTLVAKVQA